MRAWIVESLFFPNGKRQPETLTAARQKAAGLAAAVSQRFERLIFEDIPRDNLVLNLYDP